jgi:RNA polymerase sigma-70 factor (ECF subfamily)
VSPKHDIPTEPLTDEQLLQRYTQGDTDAFEHIVERYRRELFHFLVRFIGDPALAEDVFQETFLQVHLSAEGFDVSRRLKPWLFTIAANKARDALRQRLRHQTAPLDAALAGSDQGTTYADLMPSDIPPPDANLTNQQARQAVDTIVAAMPDHLRTVLLLCYFQEMPYQDIADALDVPLGTVKSRLHAAVSYFAHAWRAAAAKTGHDAEPK